MENSRDRVGEWTVNFTSIISLPFLIFTFLAAPTANLAVLSLIPLGMMLSATFSVMVVMGQRFLPARIGLAAGVTLGIGRFDRRLSHTHSRKSRRFPWAACRPDTAYRRSHSLTGLWLRPPVSLKSEPGSGKRAGRMRLCCLGNIII